jgi:hypothetical protein
MAAPNIISATTVKGKTFVTNLTTTGSILILSNSFNSNKVFKVESLLVANRDTVNNVNITANFYNSSSVSKALTSGSLAFSVTVPAKSSLVILDKASSIYLEENKSIGAIAGTANKLTVVCTYEDIS